MLECYHVACVPLRMGSVIEPGNWGRILNLYSYPLNQASGNIVARELILEATRKVVAPSKPSRLEAAFCCPTLDSAKIFRAENKRFIDIIYKVSIDTSMPIHYGNWNHVTPANGQSFFGEMDRLAKEYWTTEWCVANITTLEIVTLSPLAIIEHIE